MLTLYSRYSLYLFLLLGCNSCSYFYKKYYTNPDQCYVEALEKQPYDALIVPGFPHHQDSMSFVVQDRVYWAIHLYKKGLVKNLIFSGSAVYTPYVEAQVMALYAQQLGIPKEHIWVENQAEHSTENLYYSYRLAQQQGFKTIALATEVAQSSFIKSINDQRFKLRLDFIPIVYDTLARYNKEKASINQELAMKKDFVSIMDRENILKRLWGTRGRKVKKLLKEEQKVKRRAQNVEKNMHKKGS
jgi:hypothetical protein